MECHIERAPEHPLNPLDACGGALNVSNLFVAVGLAPTRGVGSVLIWVLRVGLVLFLGEQRRFQLTQSTENVLL